MGWLTPFTTVPTATTAEIVPTDQPNDSCQGLKNRPKPLREPTARNDIKKVVPTMNHP